MFTNSPNLVYDCVYTPAQSNDVEWDFYSRWNTHTHTHTHTRTKAHAAPVRQAMNSVLLSGRKTRPYLQGIIWPATCSLRVFA